MIKLPHYIQYIQQANWKSNVRTRWKRNINGSSHICPHSQGIVWCTPTWEMCPWSPQTVFCARSALREKPAATGRTVRVRCWASLFCRTGPQGGAPGPHSLRQWLPELHSELSCHASPLARYTRVSPVLACRLQSGCTLPSGVSTCSLFLGTWAELEFIHIQIPTLPYCGNFTSKHPSFCFEGSVQLCTIWDKPDKER